MSIKKKFLKSKPICKATFSLTKDLVESANTVSIVGEFNNWDTAANPMKKLKNGSFTQTIDLEQGKEYQFRYLIDNLKWINDTEADKYVPTIGNSENSVIAL